MHKHYTSIRLLMEQAYLNLVSNVLEKGLKEEGRNGITISTFGETMVFDLTDNTIPLLTTKKVAWKTCFRELMWFIRGQTDNTILQTQNVKIWNENASRDFLDSRGLHNLQENDLGPVYGHQWRHFNSPYSDCDTDYTGKGVDQLENIITMLKDPAQRNSRRILMTAWNPCQIDEMALPPCHVMVQFKVANKTNLSCILFQRSGDIGLGVPFNIASYSFLTHLLAHHCGLVADKFIHFIGDAHIYEDHIDSLKLQIEREPYDFPKMRFTSGKENIEDYNVDDIEWITEYLHHDDIKMKMVA